MRPGCTGPAVSPDKQKKQTRSRPFIAVSGRSLCCKCIYTISQLCAGFCARHDTLSGYSMKHPGYVQISVLSIKVFSAGCVTARGVCRLSSLCRESVANSCYHSTWRCWGFRPVVGFSPHFLLNYSINFEYGCTNQGGCSKLVYQLVGVALAPI